MNKNKTFQSPSPEAPKVANLIRIGVIMLVVFVGGFLLWATLANIESAAVAPGIIVVESNRKSIQHLEGGIVENIKVREGDRVRVGDVLVTLDRTRALANLALIQGQTNMLLAKEAALKAFRDHHDAITFPKRLTQSSDPVLKEITDEANKLFQARKETLDNGLRILKNRIQQLRDEIESLRAKVTANDTQLTLINEELTAWNALAEKSYIDRPKVLSLKREAARLQGEKEENLALISRAEQKMSETELQIENLGDSTLQDILKELEETQFNLSANLEKETAAKDILDRTIIKAPINGTVLNLKAHTIGGTIGPREVIMDIVPQQERLIVEARVNPNDIDVVHPGLLTKVRLTAYKQRTTPVLEGVVDKIAPDLLYDERSNTSYYNARIIVDESELRQLKHITLYPGMPVQVFIITDERTPLNYFLKPIFESFTRAFRED